MLDDTNLLAHAQINVFHNRFDSTPASTVTLAHALEMIRTGVYADQVRLLQQILTRQGKATYDREKAYRLAAFTFTGRFLPTRGNANLRQHSGIVHGDLDHLRTVVAIKQAIADNPRTAYAFISPSGVGLKLGVHIPLVPDDTAYKHAWHAVSTAYEALYGERWDPSGKDVSRLCFISHDPASTGILTRWSLRYHRCPSLSPDHRPHSSQFRASTSATWTMPGRRSEPPGR